MTTIPCRILLLTIVLFSTLLRAQPTTTPSADSKQSTDAFAAALDLAPLARVSVLHNQTLKTFDSYARQTLSQITGRGSLDGHDAVFSILDIAFRPQVYADRNLIQIKNVPLRTDFDRLEMIDAAEKQRILKEGKISLQFWFRPEVQALARQIQSSAVFKATAIDQVQTGAFTLRQICRPFPTFPEAALIPPSGAEPPKKPWRNINEIAGNVDWWADGVRRAGLQVPAKIEGYDDQLLDDLAVASNDLARAWADQNAPAVNEQIKRVADILPRLNPAIYPSELKRSAEVLYNRLAKMTIPGVMFYFAAFCCFLLSARSGMTGLRLWGLRLFTVGFVIHTLGIAVRWWLVEKSTDDWFHSIPIRNQFESVMMSAWFGAMVGLILELRFARSIFGAAASFVGWLSLLAIFAAPFITGKEIGGEIGQVSGVLMSYWLYIHVTMVTASYALIGMSFMLGVWWLVRYYRSFGTLRKAPARQLSSDASDLQFVSTSVNGGALIARPTILNTLAQMIWVRSPNSGLVASSTQSNSSTMQSSAHLTDTNKSMLPTLDLCNLVILQLVVLTLGVGIILGAIWADMSWGRPWGWDPKETFALVTWIVYLIILHVRLVSENKAWWTAVLAIVGFFVMLFNWIGVNFFLVGLHSYA